jgi:hypothetical protein
MGRSYLWDTAIIASIAGWLIALYRGRNGTIAFQWKKAYLSSWGGDNRHKYFMILKAGNDRENYWLAESQLTLLITEGCFLSKES